MSAPKRSSSRSIVTDGGQFVRGLKLQDFEVFEDGVRQPIASFVNEESALDLVLAVDVSGSMEHALDDVKAAVKQLLSKLRPGDAATVVGFNDTFFIAAEREKNRQVREEAVDLLSSWGGTALYDATIHALDMVSRAWGRKGVVIFSDGDDQNSVTTRQTALARVQASDAMLYTVVSERVRRSRTFATVSRVTPRPPGGRRSSRERRRSSTACSSTS